MPDTQKQLHLIAALLSRQTTLSLATTGQESTPFVAPLFYIADSQLTLYWLSSPSSRHSLNLENNPRAAATVYAHAENWKQIRGLQISGLAHPVTAPARRASLIKAYCDRFKLGRVLSLAARQSCLYALDPDLFRYIDNARGFASKFELLRGSQGWISSGR